MASLNSASSSGAGSGGQKKPERIEKELLLLRNLPNSYKLGKRVTSLGTIIYVSSKDKHARGVKLMTCLYF